MAMMRCEINVIQKACILAVLWHDISSHACAPYVGFWEGPDSHHALGFCVHVQKMFAFEAQERL